MIDWETFEVQNHSAIVVVNCFKIKIGNQLLHLLTVLRKKSENSFVITVWITASVLVFVAGIQFS